MSDQVRRGGEPTRHGDQPTRVPVKLRGTGSYIGAEASVDPFLTRVGKPKGACRLLWFHAVNVSLSQLAYRGFDVKRREHLFLRTLADLETHRLESGLVWTS